MDIRLQAEARVEEMLHALEKLVRYNSVEGAGLPGMPFGEEPAKCLEEALSIAEELGFRVKNLDNYCGYAEIGEGDEIIGVAGHLDIVPAGEGWHYEPFRLTRVGDAVYGRGTTDDKGPMVEALYAALLLKENGVPLKKRIRLIFGCNEETGSKCMAHYNEVAEPLTAGFTPDGNFPCIYGEKGHMAMVAESKSTRILSMNGGFVSNAVCNRAVTLLPSGAVDIPLLRERLAATKLTEFTVREAEEGIEITAVGTAAHASMPLLGVNAAGETMRALAEAGFKDDFVEFYNEKIGTKCDGSGCGIDFKDEYGDLTFCNGIVRTEEGKIRCLIDIRVPVTVTEEALREAITPHLDSKGGKFEIIEIGKPLFYPRESALVNALYGAYREVTGDEEHLPEVIGGGTYAKSLPGIIAFGPEMPGVDYRIHNADEFTTTEDMVRNTVIYYKALEKLLQ